MTASRYVTIWCDGIRDIDIRPIGVEPSDDLVMRDQTCGAWAGGSTSVASIERATAKANGWAVGLPGGKDYCPGCKKRELQL